MQRAQNAYQYVKLGRGGQLRDWSFAREQFGDQLKTFYERCMTDELPPRLRELLKKLESQRPGTGVQVSGKTNESPQED